MSSYLIFFVFFSGVFAQSFPSVYEFYLEHFERSAVETEYMAYQNIKKNPLPAGVFYIAIPWAGLINKKKLGLAKKITLPIENGVTVCQHIHYEKIIPILKKIGISVLFTPHASKVKTYDNIVVKPFPHVAKNGVSAAAAKDVRYSFIGCNTHPVRTVLFKMSHPENAIIKERKHWHWARDSFKPDCMTKEQQHAEMIEYQEVLARSRFSLCPRGTGPSTIRFWESLQAGAIPVLLADEMSLPEGFDWDSCVIQIAEKDAEGVAEIIAAISFEKEQEMMDNCLKAHEFFSGNSLERCIRLFYGDESLVSNF